LHRLPARALGFCVTFAPVAWTSAIVLALSLAGRSVAADNDDIGSYPLDSIARELARGEALPCKRVVDKLVVYRGDFVRYQSAVRVYEAFVPRLRALEQIVIETSKDAYGRAPRRIQQLGSYNCREMRIYANWISEHALGNAIDVAGFDFAAMPRGEPLPPGVPSELRAAFSVRIQTHWNGKRGAAAVHSRFLRDLARRVIARPEIFRTLLGPAWPGHSNHFHFDMAPYRVVEIFETVNVRISGTPTSAQ
jgi:hypothetical protein